MAQLPAHSVAPADHNHPRVAQASVGLAGLAVEVYGTTTPVEINPDDAGTAGVALTLSRSDHGHGFPTATAIELTGVNAEGSSSSGARADHNHAFPQPDSDVIATQEGTTSAAFTDLATAGPASVITVPASGKVKVSIYSWIQVSAAGNVGIMSFALSGGNTRAAQESESIAGDATVAQRFGATFLITGLTPGSTTFTAKYRRTPAGTGTFQDRTILVEPVL